MSAWNNPPWNNPPGNKAKPGDKRVARGSVPMPKTHCARCRGFEADNANLSALNGRILFACRSLHGHWRDEYANAERAEQSMGRMALERRVAETARDAAVSRVEAAEAEVAALRSAIASARAAFSTNPYRQPATWMQREVIDVLDAALAAPPAETDAGKEDKS